MPIYEFRCEDCGKKSEILLFPSPEKHEPSCPNCKGSHLRRVMSSFAYHRSESDRLTSIDTSRPQGEDYYRDDRNIGLWAKKRLKEIGYDPGPEFDGIVENARKKVAEQLSD